MDLEKNNGLPLRHILNLFSFCKVCHDYSRGLYNEEEDEEMKERIIAYVQAGYSLDRTCPGCNKVFRQGILIDVYMLIQGYILCIPIIFPSLCRKSFSFPNT